MLRGVMRLRWRVFSPVGAGALGLILLGLWLRLGASSTADRWWLQTLQSTLEGTGGGFWSAGSVCGLGLSVWMMVAALDRRRCQAIAAATLCLPLGGLLTHLPKWGLPTLRPAAVLSPSELLVMGEPILRSASMPSGHALTVLAGAVIVGRCLPMGWGWRGILGLVVLWVPLSRVLTGAHWPSDVLVGAGLGGLAGLLACHGARVTRLAGVLRQPMGVRGVAVAEIAAACALISLPTGYPDAWPMQAALALMGGLSAWQRWDPTGATRMPPGWAARLVVGCVLAGVLLSVLFTQGLMPTRHILAQAWQVLPVWGLVLALIGWWLSYALRAERLRREWLHWAAQQSPPRAAPSRADCVALFLHHNAALALMPMRTGEAGYPLWLRRRWGVPVATSLASLLWLRVQDAGVLLFLTLWWWLPSPQALVASGLMLGGGVVILRRWGRSGRRWDGVSWCLALCNWCVRLSVVSLLLWLWIGLPLWWGARATLGGEWAAALPFQAPAGLGSYEAGAWAALAWSGLQIDPHVLQALVPAALTLHVATVLLAMVSWGLWQALQRLWHWTTPSPSTPTPEPTPSP